jgi:hypothetical protein
MQSARASEADTARPLELSLPCRIPDLVGAVRSDVPDGLVDAAAWTRLGAVRDPLPPVGREAALECRLEAGPGPVDFELCLRGPCRPRLADALAKGALRKVGSDWRRTAGLLGAWCDPTSRLHHVIHAVWLEIDVPEDGGEPRPFAVVTLDGRSLYASGVADRETLASILREALDLMAGGLDPTARTAVERCLSRLPDFAQVLHAAVRPTSAGDIVRLVVAMPWREAPATLARLGWPGRPDVLERELARLCPRTLVHSFNLDIGAGLGPRVGVEFHHPTSPREDDRWIHLLDVLEERGACCPRKRRALEEWGARSLAEPAPGVRIDRDLLVKVVTGDGESLRAKAYLPFSPVLALG